MASRFVSADGGRPGQLSGHRRLRTRSRSARGHHHPAAWSHPSRAARTTTAAPARCLCGRLGEQQLGLRGRERAILERPLGPPAVAARTINRRGEGDIVSWPLRPSRSQRLTVVNGHGHAPGSRRTETRRSTVAIRWPSSRSTRLREQRSTLDRHVRLRGPADRC